MRYGAVRRWPANSSVRVSFPFLFASSPSAAPRLISCEMRIRRLVACSHLAEHAAKRARLCAPYLLHSRSDAMSPKSTRRHNNSDLDCSNVPRANLATNSHRHVYSSIYKQESLKSRNGSLDVNWSPMDRLHGQGQGDGCIFS